MTSIINRLLSIGNGRKQAYHDIIECLVAALEARDIYTSGHSNRVADMSYELAIAMGLKGHSLETVHIAAHLHDIGKMGIPDNVLNKVSKLSRSEWEQIKLHPEIGSNILKKSKDLKVVAEVILHHHERWDGKGYPKGLRQDCIPLGARIIAVSDSIDAMTTARPYREALSWEKCMEEIRINKGIQFDPVIVEAAMKLWPIWAKKSNNSDVTLFEDRLTGTV